jgi:hypothetical protein
MSDLSQNPKWQLAAIEDVNPAEVKNVFAPLEGHPPPF